MAGPWQAGVEPISGYRLTDLLGRGGFGEVWRAEAPGGVLKAVKIVAPRRFSSVTSESSAGREFAALSRVKDIRHPFLLSIERFELTDGWLIVVTELADRNLEDRFEDCQAAGLRGIPRGELLGYLREAAEALDVLNGEHAIQHLDIKPANLFLVQRHCKIGDFGLAITLEGQAAPGAAGVTPQYGAPETFDGWASRHSDQYSLAISYQMLLTGTLPFAGPSPRQFLLQHLTGTPNLSALPEEDRPALEQALAKKPEDRFPDCRSFVAALRDGGVDTASPSLPDAASVTSPPAPAPLGSVRAAVGRATSVAGEGALPAPNPLPDEIRRLALNVRSVGYLAETHLRLAGLAWASPPPTAEQVVAELARDASVAAELVRACQASGRKAARGKPAGPADATSEVRPLVRRLGPYGAITLLTLAALTQSRHWLDEAGHSETAAWCRGRCYWTGSLARALARQVDDVSPDLALQLGFSQEMGMLALQRAYPKRYRLYLKRSWYRPDEPLLTTERDWIGTTHADASAGLLELWGLPRELVASTAWHHSPAVFAVLPPARRMLMEIVLTADRWANLADASYRDRLADPPGWASVAGVSAQRLATSILPVAWQEAHGLRQQLDPQGTAAATLPGEADLEAMVKILQP